MSSKSIIFLDGRTILPFTVLQPYSLWRDLYMYISLTIIGTCLIFYRRTGSYNRVTKINEFRNSRSMDYFLYCYYGPWEDSWNTYDWVNLKGCGDTLFMMTIRVKCPQKSHRLHLINLFKKMKSNCIRKNR